MWTVWLGEGGTYISCRAKPAFGLLVYCRPTARTPPGGPHGTSQAPEASLYSEAIEVHTQYLVKTNVQARLCSTSICPT
eukprot:4301237-Pleurochrysis_carterae.AAC.1